MWLHCIQNVTVYHTYTVKIGIFVGHFMFTKNSGFHLVNPGKAKINTKVIFAASFYHHHSLSCLRCSLPQIPYELGSLFLNIQ
jgi:hypothetical protein